MRASLLRYMLTPSGSYYGRPPISSVNRPVAVSFYLGYGDRCGYPAFRPDGNGYFWYWLVMCARDAELHALGRFGEYGVLSGHLSNGFGFGNFAAVCYQF